MAEFCKECFIKHLKPTKEEEEHIILSEEVDFCEGCGNYDYVVEGIDLNARSESN